jgi:hypothetical protein
MANKSRVSQSQGTHPAELQQFWLLDRLYNPFSLHFLPRRVETLGLLTPLVLAAGWQHSLIVARLVN